MAYLVITGGGSRVTSDRLRTPEISTAVLNFRNSLVKDGAKIVTTRLGADGVDVDVLPADADPELEPIRFSLLLPWTDGAAAFKFEDSDQAEDEEEIPVELGEPAIAALEDEASALGVVSLEAWRARRGL